MSSFPATQNTGNLIQFIGEIGEVGTPDKLTTSSLSEYGYTSSNDRSIVGVLRHIGLIDEGGSPTDRWRSARTKPKVAVAEGLLSGYKSLYQVHPNAHDKDYETIHNYFKSKTEVGEATVKRISATFRALAEYADFSNAKDVSPAAGTGAEQRPTPDNQSSFHRTSHKDGMTINLNVELSLPADEDGKVYEAFFKAMKKHLLENDK